MANTDPQPQPKSKQQQQNRGRRKPKSRYGSQLSEKQELKSIYGIREAQLRNYYKEAHRVKQETGPHLVQLLESRLDNAIFRSGFALTRAQARQMATHRLFTVNGRPVDIPSLHLNTDDIVAVKESKKSKSYFENFDKRMQNVRPPDWLLINPGEFSFKVVKEPSYEEANLGVDVKAVVELFAR